MVAADAMKTRNIAEQETAQLSDAMFSSVHWRGDTRGWESKANYKLRNYAVKPT